MSFNPFTAIGAKILAGLLIAALIFAGVQSWRATSLSDQLDQARIALGAERASHEITKRDYAEAQAYAQGMEAARIAAVATAQQEISHDLKRDYRDRLARLRADYQRLRREADADRTAARAAADQPVSGLSAAPGRAAEAAADRFPARQSEDDLAWRLKASEQALQLDALIDWVERQAAIDPNRTETSE